MVVNGYTGLDGMIGCWCTHLITCWSNWRNVSSLSCGTGFSVDPCPCCALGCLSGSQVEEISAVSY